MKAFSRNREKVSQRQVQRAANEERDRSIKLVRPVIKALGEGPVAVVVMPTTNSRRKEVLAGIKNTYTGSNVLQLNARRVQRVDTERIYVEDTLEKLRKLRRNAEDSSVAAVFVDVHFPKPETIEHIGRGTPEVIEWVTPMIEERGPNDPNFIFIGNGTPEDLPTSPGFAHGLDRGILNLVGVTFALTEEHGLTTMLPAANHGNFTHRVSPSPDLA